MCGNSELWRSFATEATCSITAACIIHLKPRTRPALLRLARKVPRKVPFDATHTVHDVNLA